MRAREVLRRIQEVGGEVLRRESSHVRVRVGRCYSTVPVHRGRDIGRGLLRQIERDLEPCLWKGWLRGEQ